MQHPPPQPSRGPSTILSGSAWMVGLRWAIRFIGLGSTVVLARLLAPEDFGLVAMAMLVAGLNEVFAPAGQTMALIRHPDPTRQHWDSAWTLAVYVGLGLTLVLVAAAPLAAPYFGDPRVVPLIQVLSLRAAIGGFENIGVVAFRKELRFRREFGFLVGQKVLTAGVTLVLAVVWRDYWALAAGLVTGRCLGVALSYAVHPYRPRLCHARIRELAPFTFWMQLVSINHFLQAKTDEFVVGGVAGTAEMGYYNVASDVATAPTAEFIRPIERAMYPIYATHAGDLRKLAGTYLGVLSGVAVLACPAGIGVVLVAEDLVAVVLGAQWGPAVPLMRWLALEGMFYAFVHGAQTVFAVTGHARLAAGLTWLNVAVLIPALAVAGWLGSVEAVAIARAGVTIAMAPVYFGALSRIMPLRMTEVAARLWRPLAAAAAMAAALVALPPLPVGLAAARLAADTAAGALAFAAVLTLLWWLSGRPDGAERAILRRMAQLLGRRPA